MNLGSKDPWDHPPPKKTGGAKLTEASKKKARARAKAAGRRYPNLVDNMWAAMKQKEELGENGGPTRI